MTALTTALLAAPAPATPTAPAPKRRTDAVAADVPAGFVRGMRISPREEIGGNA